MNKTTTGTEQLTKTLIDEINRLRHKVANAQQQYHLLSEQYQQLEAELELAQAANDPASVDLLSLSSASVEEGSLASPDYQLLAQLLHKAAIISQKISHIHQPNELINKTISLIRSSFKLYHVHIYLFDEQNQALKIHVGSGKVGEQLKKEEHRIPLEAKKSLVALCARQKEMVLVQDVRRNPLFLANPLLPNTQAEVAIPLQYGRSLLGVLDIQDNKPNRFGPAEIDTFITLAGHIAIALQNARLFTQRSQIEQELKFQADLLQNVSDAIIATDNEFRVQSWNKAAETMYGWQQEEVIGKLLGEVLQPVYDDQPREAIIAEYLSEGYWGGKIKHRRKDGVLIPILTAVTAIKDTQGTIIGAVCVNRDITQIVTFEETLRERTRTLEARNEDLAQFAYAASHDLQEPLRMISSYLQLVAQRYQEQLDDEAAEFIGYAVDGANRMRQLITDLLAYSRIGHNSQTFTSTDLNHVLEQVLDNLELRIEETNATITHDPLPTLKADKTQMMQLLQNLISNAIKFRKNVPPLIHISARQEKDQWIIQVADNGIGMEQKLSEKIFVIFHRLHTQDEYPGTGIGLAICKKIVQNHGGNIWVDSKPGEGSTFSFSLRTKMN